MISQDLLETGSSFEQLFKPVLITGEWQIAVLRQCKKVHPEKIQQLERHNNTDEVFILTTGEANLIIVDEKEGEKIPFVVPMDLNVAYNVKRSVWHHIVLSADAHVFIFEKADTSKENSDYKILDADVQERIRGMVKV